MFRTLDIPRPRAIALLCSSLSLLAAFAVAQGGGARSKAWVNFSQSGYPTQEPRTNGLSAGPTILPLEISTALWTYTSDGSWIAEDVSLGNGGTQVITQHGDFLNALPLLSSHDADPPAPIWSDGFTGLNFHRVVASAEGSDVHAALHQRFITGSQQWREAVLRVYDSRSSTPRWEYVLPTQIAAHPYATLRLSRDGGFVVAAVYDSLLSAVQVTLFKSDSAVPSGDALVALLGPHYGFEISPDASTAAVLSGQKLTILDLETLSPVHEEFLFGPTVYGSLGFSGDGASFAVGVDDGVRIYERTDTGGYELTHTHALPAGGYCRRLAISHDGGTLALGVNFSADVLTSRMEAVDLETLATTMTHEAHGTGAFQNQVADVAISDDGRRFAVGLWGDEPGDVHELLVFRSHKNEPLMSAPLGGSAQDVELSADGRRLAVASKGTHANVWGGGGAIRLFDVGSVDFALEGIPRPGATVSLVHRTRPEWDSRVYVAPELADAPVELPGLGSGLIYLDPESMVGLPDTTSDLEGVARTDYTIPADAALVGTTIYFQALSLDGGAFSKRWIPMTILP